MRPSVADKIAFDFFNLNVKFFCNLQRIIDFGAEIADGTFDLRVSKQGQCRPQIACPAIKDSSYY